jgi:hypothetical protein
MEADWVWSSNVVPKTREFTCHGQSQTRPKITILCTISSIRIDLPVVEPVPHSAHASVDKGSLPNAKLGTLWDQ